MKTIRIELTEKEIDFAIRLYKSQGQESMFITEQANGTELALKLARAKLELQ